MKKITVFMAVIMLILLAACSAANSSAPSSTSMDMLVKNSFEAERNETQKNIETYGMSGEAGVAYDNAAPEATPMPQTSGSIADITLTDPNRKLIRTASVSLETTAFDDSVAKLEAMCLNYQGFVEHSSVYGASITARGKQFRSAEYTFRIPSIRYNEFLNSMGTIGNVINKSQNSQDITDTYYDTASRLEILELRRDRLMGLLEKETNSKSIIEFENSLSDTLYEIDRLTGSLRKYDSLVDYSTISIFLNEVEAYTEVQPVTPAPETVGERIAAAFEESAKAIGEFFVGLTVFVLGNILYLLIWGVVIAAAVVILKKTLGRGKSKKQISVEKDGTKGE